MNVGRREGGRGESDSHFDGNVLSANISEGVETGPAQEDMHNITIQIPCYRYQFHSQDPFPIFQHFMPTGRGVVLTLADRRSPKVVRTVMTWCR